jgi:signal peptidase
MISKLRDLLRNEYVRSILLLLVIILCIAGFWIGLKAYLMTSYPLLAVASGSMEPTLNKGDLIIVQGGLEGSTIIAEDEVGDVIIFYRPGDPDELIVHRAIEKWEDGSIWKFHTKGDANDNEDSWIVRETDIIGKVIGVIPYVGHIPLFVHTANGKIIIIILIVILVLLEFVIPTAQKKRESDMLEDESDLASVELI